jgi:class 3 adenylate cyclase
LATRLQELAEAGCVVIAEQTRRLLGEGFVAEELGPLKGFADALQAFAIAGDATPSPELTMSSAYS